MRNLGNQTIQQCINLRQQIWMKPIVSTVILGGQLEESSQIFRKIFFDGLHSDQNRCAVGTNSLAVLFCICERNQTLASI